MKAQAPDICTQPLDESHFTAHITRTMQAAPNWGRRTGQIDITCRPAYGRNGQILLATHVFLTREAADEDMVRSVYADSSPFEAGGPMEKVTFDAKLSLDENLSVILSDAEKKDPDLGKLLNSLMPILANASAENRKSVRSTFHQLSKSDLDQNLAKDVQK